MAISNRNPHQPGSLTGQQRAQLRLRSIGWALIAALVAGAIGLGLAALAGEAAGAVELARASGLLDAALRAGGCGFFYGLLAFHLQRVDPDDGHLQAGLVGAVCGLVRLAAPLAGWSPAGVPLPAVMMAAVSRWLPLWLPLIGSALLLHTAQRQLPVLRP